MVRRQEVPIDSLGLESRRLGPLPLINHFLERLGLEALLDRFVPTPDPRTRIPHARCLGVLLRSFLVERQPLYRQQEMAQVYRARDLGLTQEELGLLGDDRLGRALDRLFDADRSALITEVALAGHERFGVTFERFHNDSTTVSFCGQYKAARGRSIRGKSAPFITFGYSKARRPDLKQLLYVLTCSGDGHVPVGFRCEAGSRNDSPTHIETWDALVKLTGGVDFLYIADSKLCAYDPLDHISRRGGRLLTVLPRSRREDAAFRRWIQTHVPDWEKVRDRPNPRGKNKPRDVWRVWRSHVPSREGWPLTWVWSTLLARHQSQGRQDRIDRACEALEELRTSLESPRSRTRKRSQVHERLKEILTKLDVTRYLRVRVHVAEDHSFKQFGPGRPGPNTKYRRVTRKHFTLTWRVDEDAVKRDRKHDGMYPLLSNDSTLSPKEAWKEHKRQPRLERRFRQLKDDFHLAPVLLKNEGRVEAVFFLYALVLIVEALIEREIRLAMKRDDIASLEIYPENRSSTRPTTPQILRLFDPLEQHVISADGTPIKTVDPTLTELQEEVLALLGVPAHAYGGTGRPRAS